MFNKIKSLVEQKDYVTALPLIEQELKGVFNLDNEEDELRWKVLLGFRVAAKTFLGQHDELVLDILHRKKFYSESIHTVDNKFRISIIFESIFLFKCDAYINAIHVDKLFNIAQRSASQGFVRRLSYANVEQQVAKQKKPEMGDYLILKHENLPAPFSYHIVCYEGEDRINLDALRVGIQKVLDDASKKGLSRLASVSLGFDAVASAKEDEKHEVAETITDKVGETVVGFFRNTSSKNVPHVYFAFVSMNSYSFFDKAFTKWASRDKNYTKYVEKLDENMHKLISSVYTTNAAYVEQLKNIRPELNEKSAFLLLGETGVGKSYLAGRIHKHSDRALNKFVSLNCSLVKGDRIYSYLFGWERGAFTGAIKDHAGLVEQANGGTLFLDEIGYMDLDVQKALLTFLDTGIFQRYGETNERRADVRLICGTNQDLRQLIEWKEFANDLYERISQVEIEIPPLRKRPEDILLITDIILETLNKEKNYNLSFHNTARELLKTYKWPGNMRQLKTYLERVHNKCSDENILIVNDAWVKKYPPRDYLYKSRNDFEILESTLNNILYNWDGSKGQITHDLLEPILARIYIDVLNKPKENASTILGIDGSGGKKSTLMKRYEQYPAVKDRLKKS